MTADTAYITYTVTVKDLDGEVSVFTKRQSFSKSYQGTTGPTGDPGVEGDGGQYTRTYFRRRATSGDTPAGGGTYDYPTAPAKVPSDGVWYPSMPADNGNPGWMTSCVYLDPGGPQG